MGVVIAIAKHARQFSIHLNGRDMTKRNRRYSKEEFARRGDEIYGRIVWPTLKPSDADKFVAIDIETGEFEVDRDELAACNRLYARLPDAQPWLTRVGSLARHNLGCVPARQMLSPRKVRHR